MDQSLIDKACAWLVAQRGNAAKKFVYDTGCAVFKVFDKNFIGPDRATVCHSSLSSGDGTAAGVATLSNWAAYTGYAGHTLGPAYKADRKSEIADRFYDWFINRSFYSPWIIAPSFEFARDVGIVVSADAPANVVGAICTLSRTMSEHPHFAQRMLDLIDKFGMIEELAFYISFGINITYSGEGSHGYGSTNTNHTIIALTSDLLYARNFVSRKPQFLSAPYSVGRNYRDIMRMWGGGDRHDSSVEQLARDLKPFIKAVDGPVKAGDDVVIPNPFARVAKSTATWSDDELHKIYIPALMEATKTDDRQILAA